MQKKKGVSLIVLSITILVMAILAATAIIALEDSGIIGRSKNTVNKQNYIQEYERLQVIKNGLLTDNLGEITIDEYITELTNKGLIETGVTTNSDGSKSVTTKTGFIANVMQDGESNLIISLGTSNATIALNPTSISGDITSGPVNKTITVNATNVTGDITWTTSNANVATVTGNNSSATVTLKNVGTATITATYGNAKASCEVTVTGTVATPTITLNKTTISKTIDSGSTATETITATTANITGSLTWTSSNTSVATVSASGNTATVTMKAGGTATITATYGSTSASCTVVVTENETETYTHYLSGVWTWKDEVGYTSDIEQWVDFQTTEGLICDGIKIYKLTDSSAKGYAILIDYHENHPGTLYDWDNKYEDSWVNSASKYIDFGTSEMGVSEEFYNWFTTNATQETSNDISQYIYFTDGRYLLTAKNNATWNEIVGDGLTVRDTMGSTWDLSIVNGYIEAANPDNDAPAGTVSGTLVLATDRFDKYSEYYWDESSMLLYGE